MTISNDLIEAYKGVYEDTLEQDLKLDGFKDLEDMIKTHSPKKRLEVWLQWNGILGYSSRIYELARGEL